MPEGTESLLGISLGARRSIFCVFGIASLFEGGFLLRSLLVFTLAPRAVVGAELATDPVGPHPLRSGSCVWGFPDVRPGDRERARQGNLFAHFTSALLKLAHILHVLATLENHMMSRLWLVPGVRAASDRGSSVVLDMCQYGTTWLKPTRF